MSVEKRNRHTIMDGRVVQFAMGFEERHDVFGLIHEAVGPFEVSASRDAVMVHRARCTSAEEVDDLIEAIRLASITSKDLSSIERGNFLSRAQPENQGKEGPAPKTITDYVEKYHGGAL